MLLAFAVHWTDARFGASENYIFTNNVKANRNGKKNYHYFFRLGTHKKYVKTILEFCFRKAIPVTIKILHFLPFKKRRG
jgi:hypothetical protein